MDTEPGDGRTGQEDGSSVGRDPGAGAGGPSAGTGPQDGTDAPAGSDTGDGPDGPRAVEPEQEPPEGNDPLRFNKWMKRSATGAVLTGISLGLREALETNKKEPAFMIEASGQPDDPDNPIQLHFDPDNPADTVAVIRQPVDKPHPDPPPPGV